MIEGVKPYWTQDMLDEVKREGQELFERMNGRAR
jgi:hypothetical protein